MKKIISRNQMIKAFEIVINKFEFYFFDLHLNVIKFFNFILNKNFY